MIYPAPGGGCCRPATALNLFDEKDRRQRLRMVEVRYASGFGRTDYRGALKDEFEDLI